MSKILILTGYTRTIEWDNYGACDYGELSSTNHKKYADIHGYSFHKEIFNPKDYIGIHLTWGKIYSLYKFLSHYEYVVWIDSDAIFTDYKFSIEDIIGFDDPNLVLTKAEWDRENNIAFTGISTGFMIFKNSEWSSGFLSDMVSYKGNLKKNYGFHEQTYISEYLYEMLKKSKTLEDLNWYKGKEDIESPISVNPPGVKILPYRFQRIYNEFDTPYIYHAGGSTPTKMSRIKRAIKEKNNMININYNFEDGAFLEIQGPIEDSRKFIVEFIDNRNNNILNRWEVGINHWVKSGIKYYIPWKLKISDSEGNLLWIKEIDFMGKYIYIELEFSTVEDSIKSLNAVTEFSRINKCNVEFSSHLNIPKENWGDSKMVDKRDVKKCNYDACYKLGIYLDDNMDLSPKMHNEKHLPHWDILGISRDILGITV